MHAQSIAGDVVGGDRLSGGKAAEKLSWNLAAPLILATSVGLWVMIGQGIAALVG